MGKRLESTSFECLDAESKTAILAFLCNELLYCRNVIREIEGNMEEMTRLKGEKWLREGKSRALRAVQARKRAENRRKVRCIEVFFIFLAVALTNFNEKVSFFSISMMEMMVMAVELELRALLDQTDHMNQRLLYQLFTD